MLARKPLFLLFLLLSLGSLVLFLSGFVLAVNELTGAPAAPLTEAAPELSAPAPAPAGPEAKGAIHLVLLGDSLTRGIGDETGNGYAGHLKVMLEEESEATYVLQNLGVSGAVSASLREQLEEPASLYFLGQADAIIISIGGNDLFRGSGRLRNVDEAGIKESMAAYEQNMRQIITRIRQANQTSPILLIGLYDPFHDVDQSGMTSRVVQQWNEQAKLLALRQEKVVYVPVFDLFQHSPQTLIYSDHFHPNGEGYRLIAERLAQHLRLAFQEGEGER